MSDFRLESWMGDLRKRIGDVDLRYLKMPGTHNSGSFSYDLLGRVRCQNYCIGDQLNLGVRSFDIRLTYDDNEFYMHHNGRYDKTQSFEKAVHEIKHFCQTNPFEFIRINLSGQSGSTINNDKNILARLEELLYLLSPYIIHDTPKNQSMFENNFTLNHMVREENGSTNQIMLKQSGDEHIGNLNKGSKKDLFYSPGGIHSTWDWYISHEEPEYIRTRMPGEIMKALSTREAKDKGFFSCEWYMFAGMSFYSSIKSFFGSSDESIRSWAEQIHVVYKMFARRLFPQQLKNCNVVTFDYINSSLAKSVIRMNLCCGDLSDYTGVVPDSEKEGIACKVYEHTNYEGRSWNLTSGCYNYADFRNNGFNDIVSSVRVTPGYEAFFFKDQDYKVGKLALGQDCRSLIELGMNDNISSAIILPDKAIARSQPIPHGKPCYFYIRDKRHGKYLCAGWERNDSYAHHDGSIGYDNAKWCFEKLPHGKLDDPDTTYYRLYNKMHHTYLAGGYIPDNHVYCSNCSNDMATISEYMMWNIKLTDVQGNTRWFCINDSMHGYSLSPGWNYDKGVYHQEDIGSSYRQWTLEPVPGEADPKDYPEFLK